MKRYPKKGRPHHKRQRGPSKRAWRREKLRLRELFTSRPLRRFPIGQLRTASGEDLDKVAESFGISRTGVTFPETDEELRSRLKSLLTNPRIGP